jgi:SET domain-containing protein|tara:strand:- start:140 stop:430 length:291 start_codon:yes stop_codon:yes gene_type:complete
MTDKYRPLPDNITIKLSPIEGFGLFATATIDKMTDLGISHLTMGREIYRTPLGGFLNHSDKPNCQKIEVDGKYYVQTLEDIKEGEELTLKYTLYKV